MAETLHATPADRFGPWIERPDGVDFPYYAGEPVGLGAVRWALAWLSVAAGFAALVLLPEPDNVAALVPRALFVVIPLAVLAVLARPYWSALFRPVRGRDLLTMAGFALLNIVVSLLLGTLVASVFGASANAATDDIDGAVQVLAFYLGTGIQLVGEELFTVIPFLALLYFLTRRGTLSRKSAIVVAWLVTAVWFGAAHLPTYDWNVAQCFIVIGGARLVLTLAWIRTKNLWVCSGAHILNDWALFTPSIVAAAAFG
ncbi:CPBP family intramembrane glutamic endopeptidase [Nocardia sp. NPDC057227]|uniref:CPBP family intramembrane glutamic endopeptidase n=1 Tax=Nocardia sp. NPDC057227 TaxID=3346056 RepID=UPI00362AFF9D